MTTKPNDYTGNDIESIAYRAWRKLVNNNWANVAGEIENAIKESTSVFQKQIEEKDMKYRLLIEATAYINDQRNQALDKLEAAEAELSSLRGQVKRLEREIAQRAEPFKNFNG